MRGAGLVNIELRHEEPGPWKNGSVLTVQIVLRLYESPAEVLLGFDVDCCCVGYDGERVWALRRAMRAIQYCCNILNPLHAWPSKASYEYRLVKYALRGYAIAIPGMETVEVDLSKIISTPLSKLKGFARLVRLAMAFDDSHATGGDAKSPFVKLSVECYDDFNIVSYKSVLKDAIGPDGWNMQGSKSEARTYGEATRKELGTTLQLALGELEFTRLIYSSWRYASNGDASTALRCTAELEAFGMITQCSEDTDAGNLWVNIACVPEGKNLSIPTKLEDAWDDAKRSREYLNAKDQDLDARYFAHAAREKKGNGWK